MLISYPPKNYPVQYQDGRHTAFYCSTKFRITMIIINIVISRVQNALPKAFNYKRLTHCMEFNSTTSVLPESVVCRCAGYSDHWKWSLRAVLTVEYTIQNTHTVKAYASWFIVSQSRKQLAYLKALCSVSYDEAWGWNMNKSNGVCCKMFSIFFLCTNYSTIWY